MIKMWLIMVFLITLFAGVVMLTVQQNYRLSGNDPQIQISEDLAQKLAMNPVSQTAVVPDANIDISQSLATFEIVYDENGKVISSAAVLGGKTPTLPQGIFDYAKQHGQDRFTWQPQDGVRVAAVITYFSGKSNGYVLVGRSLREVENRESLLSQQITIWWVVSVIVSLIFSFLLKILIPHKSIA